MPRDNKPPQWNEDLRVHFGEEQRGEPHSDTSAQPPKMSDGDEPIGRDDIAQFLGDELPSGWESEWTDDRPVISEATSPSSHSEDSLPLSNREQKAAVTAQANGASRLSWIIATTTILLTGWLVGPALIERYYYARTKGELLAQYDIAKTALEDSPLAGLSAASQWVSQKVRPSVVHIRTATSAPANPDSLREWSPSLSEGQGSGVVVSSDGYILTNEHVIQDADKIFVTLSDRRDYLAELVGVDSETDLAVLKIQANRLIACEWGNSDLLQVGSLVWAVGSPFGLEQSTTQGIISAKHRRQNEPASKLHQDLLQSDVAINPGNSGGPLVNEQGKVIGINTSIVGEAFCGISFSVPSSVAREVYERLRTTGRVDRSYLGVYPRVVPGEMVAEYGIVEGMGAFVEWVAPGKAADRAGIQPGDIILRWNDQVVENDIILFRLVGLTRPNTTAQVTVLREGTPLQIAVQVDRRQVTATPR